MKPSTIAEALGLAQKMLRPVVEQSTLEAEVLLAYTLSRTRAHLHAWPEQRLTAVQHRQFTTYLTRRLNNEPIAYLTGTKEFWSLPLLVTEDTLIPRPETELLVEITLQLFSEEADIKIADLGTGCGAIALALAHERRQWQIDATDISENALQIARKNAQRLMLENISFSRGNWCTALSRNDFNVIISNPPYIAENEWEHYKQGLRFEPKHALVSGRDGLDAIRCIARSAKTYLTRGGYLLIEHGFLQGKAVRAILMANDYQKVRSENDLSGLVRVTIGLS